MSKRIDLIAIEEHNTIREAMVAIDRGACEIALVVDTDRRLLGTLTDGDVRRALLRGATLDAPIVGIANTAFTKVEESVGRAEVLDLMRARSVHQIPIVDVEGRLVGLHLLHEIIGATRRPNWAVVMAGGRGERLRPITDHLPKPMVRVAGRPILERIILHLVSYGIRRIFISINYLGEQIEQHFGDGSAFGCTIEYLREEKALGTGGALSLLPEAPHDTLLVLNGDLVTQFDVSAFLGHHAAAGFAVTVGVHEYVHSIPFGVVECDGDRVTGLREKPIVSWLANAGIYAVEPRLLPRIPPNTSYPMPALLEDCLEHHEPACIFRIDDDWLDVGRHRELGRANGRREPT